MHPVSPTRTGAGSRPSPAPDSPAPEDEEHSGSQQPPVRMLDKQVPLFHEGPSLAIHQLLGRSVSRQDVRSVDLAAPSGQVSQYEATRTFARALLACDLAMDSRPSSSVPRLVAVCRDLLTRSPAPADLETPGSLEAQLESGHRRQWVPAGFSGCQPLPPPPPPPGPLDWIEWESFAYDNEVLRLLIGHRRDLDLALPPLSFFVRHLYRNRSLFVPLFEQLSGVQQRELLGMTSLQERALSGDEEMALWYRQACRAHQRVPDNDHLWALCRQPTSGGSLLSPCFALIDEQQQLAVAHGWIRELVLKVAPRDARVLAIAVDSRDPDQERRTITLYNRLAGRRSAALADALLAQGAAFQAVLLFLYARNDQDDSLRALGTVLTEARERGMAPDRRILALPDNRGLFLTHYLFMDPGYVALRLLAPFMDSGQPALAGDGSGPGAGTHPLHRVHLCVTGPRATFFTGGSMVPDSRAAIRLLWESGGPELMLELILAAQNRGEVAWWVWLLQCLQQFPGLRSRLAQDRRASAVRVGHRREAGVALPRQLEQRMGTRRRGETGSDRLPAMLERFWDPFAPLASATQQRGLLQAIIDWQGVASAGSESDGRWQGSLLDGVLILCQPGPCRWLLGQLLGGAAPLWCQWRQRLFDGRSTAFRQLQDLLVASGCGEAPLARSFDLRLYHQLSSPQWWPGCRDPRSCLTAAHHPALFGQPASGVYGRTVWFRTRQGVLRLKLHKKGEALMDLLREPLTLLFLTAHEAGRALLGQRPGSLGCGWLADWTGWLAGRGLDPAEQQALRDSVEQAEDGAVWAVVLHTPDEGYHQYAHRPDSRGRTGASLDGIALAAHDSGTLLRHGLVPINLLPLCHQLPYGHERRWGGRCAWQFLQPGGPGVVQDWNGTGTGQGNVARAPYGLRDWADVRSLESVELDAAVGCREKRWRRGTVQLNEAGKLLTGLALLVARLHSDDFDGANPQRVAADRERIRGQLETVFCAFLEGMTANVQAVVAWQSQPETARLLEAAARQLVFWCESRPSPCFEQHLRAGTLPDDIPCDEISIPVQDAPLRASMLKDNTLMDHRMTWPLKQLSALIYLTLGHALAAAEQAPAGSHRT